MNVLNTLCIFFCFFVELVFTNQASDGLHFGNTCGDWELFKSKTHGCLKLYRDPGSNLKAETDCKKAKSHLLSIRNEEDQQFVESFLKSKKIENNIWLGLFYVNGTYLWHNETELTYTNWQNSSHNPKYTHCVEMVTGTKDFGKWIKRDCDRKYPFICQRMMTETNKMIHNIIQFIKNVIPIGLTYVQVHNTDAPSVLWPYFKWEDVSHNYAGVFLRVVEGNSDDFGKVQDQIFPNLMIDAFSGSHASYEKDEIVPKDGSWSANIFSGPGERGVSHWALKFKWDSNVNTIVPKNMAVRIWRRIE